MATIIAFTAATIVVLCAIAALVQEIESINFKLDEN